VRLLFRRHEALQLLVEVLDEDDLWWRRGVRGVGGFGLRDAISVW